MIDWLIDWLHPYNGRARRGWIHRVQYKLVDCNFLTFTSICSRLVVQLVPPTLLCSCWQDFYCHVASRGPSASVYVVFWNGRWQDALLRLSNLGPDLQNILRQSYDYLTIMPKLRSTYDGRLIYKNILRRAQGFSQVRFTCKVVRSSETVFANLADDIPERNF